MSSSSKDVPCCTSTNTSSLGADVLDPVGRTLRDVDRVAGLQPLLGAVEGDHRGAGHDEPVLGPVGVALVAEPPAGIHDHALDLVGAGIVQHGVGAPRPPLRIHRRILARTHAYAAHRCEPH